MYKDPNTTPLLLKENNFGVLWSDLTWHCFINKNDIVSAYNLILNTDINIK